MTSSAAAQLADDYVLVGAANSSPVTVQLLSMFDRRLELVNELSGISGSIVVTDADGSRWVLSSGGLLHLDAAAQLGDTLAIGPGARPPAVDSEGHFLVATYGSLTSWSADGTSLWSVPLPSGFYPTWVAVDAAGDVHVGGSLPSTWFFGGPSGLLRFSGDDGGSLGSLTYPPGTPYGNHWILQVRAAPDGTVWSNDGAYNPEPIYFPSATLFNTSRGALTGLMPFGPDGEMGGYNCVFCVDGAGRLLVPDYDWIGGVTGHPPVVTKILRYDPAQPASPQASWDLADDLRWFELGPTGEELYAVTTTPNTVSLTHTWRLVRVNLVSGAKSSVVLATTSGAAGNEVSRWLLGGDPTGFVYANTVDRTGDADGDGAANGIEAAAGSNAFDPESRPDGPKVYVAFAPGTNAIEMTLFDPDGLRNPTKGIDFATMSVTIGGSGNVFWTLLGFVTEASLSADGKTAHAVFGGLPIASDLKLRVEMSVRDRTGAAGWDWQATPPGDL